MNLDEYEREGRDRYDALSKIVAAILAVAINATKPPLRLQQIQHRAKDPQSLRGKLRDRGLTEESIERSVKDLAGCRVIFYTNLGFTRFIRSHIVRANFEVDWQRSKIHHPVPSTESEGKPFVSHNYAARLKDDRAALPEYAPYAGIWCEIQVQTTLNHAWAETSHDIVYKRPELPPGFGKAALMEIDERMNAIMRKYLMPAGYEFQKVEADFDRLLAGTALYDDEPLRKLGGAANNNDRYELIERFRDYVMPNFDDLSAESESIFGALRESIVAAPSSPLVPVETPFGRTPGKSADDVVTVAAEVLDRIALANVDASLSFFADMASKAQSVVARTRWIESAQSLALPDAVVWEGHGPQVQVLVARFVASRPELWVDQNADFLVPLIEALLKTEIEGSRQTAYNAVTIRRGAVYLNEEVVDYRNIGLSVLMRLVEQADSHQQRRRIVVALLHAVRFPYVRASNALVQRLLSEAESLAALFVTLLPQFSFALRQHVEHALFWIYRHAEDHLTSSSDAVKNVAQTLRAVILALRDTLNRDDEFLRYKMLVGHESIFRELWDKDPVNTYEEEERIRNKYLDTLASDVTLGNADSLFSQIERFITQDPFGSPSFHNVGRMFERMAYASPAVGWTYVDNTAAGGPLREFFPAVLLGLERAGEQRAVLARVEEWIACGRNLPEAIGYLGSSDAVNASTLSASLSSAIEKDDVRSARAAAQVAADRVRDVGGQSLVSEVLMVATRFLIERGNGTWAEIFWMNRTGSALYDSLDESHVTTLFDAFAAIRELHDHHTDVLAKLARRHPNGVIAVFERRIVAKAGDDLADFRAVPYRMPKLAEPLSNSLDVLIDVVRALYDRDSSLFQFRAGMLLVAIFPHGSKELSETFQARLLAGGVDEAVFVAAVLHAFNGGWDSIELCKRVVDILPTAHSQLGTVAAALRATGGVYGEFGFVTALRARRAVVEPWLRDGSEKIRAFAAQFVHNTDQDIADEQHRGEEDLELRKLNFGTEHPKDEQS